MSATEATPPNIIKPWLLPPQRAYAFTNANVVDVEAGKIIPNATVKISNGITESITSSTTSPILPSPNDYTEIDLQGRYLCPGLFDCHVHIASTPGSANIAASFATDHKISHFRQPYLVGQMLSRGFTSVRDCGGASLALKEAINDDVFPGPRLFIANKGLSQTGGHGDARGAHEVERCCGDTSMTETFDGVPAALKSARTQIRLGADFIKIMASGGVASPTDKLEGVQFTNDEVRAIAEVARNNGTYVTAHAYTSAAVRQAVENGVMGIEHGNLIDEATMKLLAERGCWLTPTLASYEAYASKRYAGFLPPANAEKNARVLQLGIESLKMAAKVGVKICHGSDLMGPLHHEQSREFAIRGGLLSSLEVLRSATVIPAAMMGQEAFLGQIKEGFAADMLILDKNPLQDVAILSDPKANIKAVIKNGRVYASRWNGIEVDVEQPARL